MTTPKIAVIDIGSNSVRLVVYDELKRTPLPLVNEKILCGLARDMNTSGKLHPKAAAEALHALGRYAALIKAMGIEQVYCYATSAVRDASDGAAFIKKLKEQTGFDITVVSGEEEATLATMGVIAAMEDVRGIVGDLGGGSLELAEVSGTQGRGDYEACIGDRVSFPIGALRLKDTSGGNPDEARAIVDKYLMQFALPERLEDKTFYAVGGGMRAVAKHHIANTNYPLGVIHEYRSKARKMLTLVKRVANLSSKQIWQIPSLPGARAETIPYTALVLERIIEIGKPRSIVFSTHGLREGILAHKLSEAARKKDALIENATDMVRYMSPERKTGWIQFAHEMYDWMSPMFRSEDEGVKRLRLAASILSRVAWHEHTAYRAEMAFRWVLDAAMPAIDHKGRVFVATAVFHRYQYMPNTQVMRQAQALLGQDMLYRARVVGAMMSLAHIISGGAHGILSRVPLALSEEAKLSIKPKNAILISEDIRRRFSRIGSLTGLDTVIEV